MIHKDVAVYFVVRYAGEDLMGAMIISSMLKQRGINVEMISADEDIERKLVFDKSVILAYSATTVTVDHYLKLNARLKRKYNFLSVFGGPHPTARPEMIEKEGVDVVCIGEGEEAFVELVEFYRSGSPIHSIRNLWVKQSGTIFKNSLRPLINDLDTLPFPDRDLFSGQSLFDSEKLYVMTGRGCPYSCSFCFNPYLNELYAGQNKDIRKRSVSNVLKEILDCRKKRPIKFVIFNDDIFTLPLEWFREFSREYRKKIALPFFCNIHIDCVTPEVASLLSEAGCFSVNFGLEAADDDTRQGILKKNISRGHILEGIRLLKQYKIRVKTSNIIGVLGIPLEKDIDTIRMNAQCKVDYASVAILAAYPNTNIAKIFKEEVSGGLLYPGMETNAGKRVLQNLRCLFAVGVAFPLLLPLISVAVRWPLGFLYRWLYLLWEGYCAYFRLYPSGLRSFCRGLKKYLWIWRSQPLTPGL